MQRLELDKNGKVILIANNVKIDSDGKLDADTLKNITGDFTCDREVAIRILGQQIGLSAITDIRWGVAIYTNDELSKVLRKQLDRANERNQEQQCDIINLTEKLASYHYNWAARILYKLHVI